MSLLLSYVVLSCAHSGQALGKGILAALSIPEWPAALVFYVAGGLVAVALLLLVKLPDGRYLYRRWDGEKLQFITSRQMWLLFGACLIVAGLPAYWLFWPYISDWLNAR